MLCITTCVLSIVDHLEDWSIRVRVANSRIVDNAIEISSALYTSCEWGSSSEVIVRAVGDDNYKNEYYLKTRD